MKRETLFKYAREHFKSEPEYLWSNLPHYVVLRHHHGENTPSKCAVPRGHPCGFLRFCQHDIGHAGAVFQRQRIGAHKCFIDI